MDKESYDSISGFITGIAVGFLLGIALVVFLYRDSVPNLKECQKSLPRDQNCILIAVPEKKNEQTN